MRFPARLMAVLRAAPLASAVVLLGGCEAEVGSDAWCKSMDGKPKGDWSVNDAGDYARHCVLGLKPDKPAS